VKRIRWFAAKWPISFRSLAAKMKANAFREDSVDGFIVDRVRDNLIYGRYIEKICYQETLIDPFGAQSVFDRTEYRQLEFTLFSEFPHIEFQDPPRSTQGFVSKMTELNNFSLAIAPLAVDLLKWISNFQSITDYDVLVDSLQISGLEMEPGVTARISIGGDKDVRQTLQRFTKGKRFDLERIHLKVPHQDRPASIQLVNTGAMKIDDEWLEDFIQPMRKALPAPKSGMSAA
jgi:hypothetical protein